MQQEEEKIILHHYAGSPFSEKVRLVLGLKGVKWFSVIEPPILPRPLLTPLAGGYRRIPVMHIGRNVYCDTQSIIRELERRFPTPSIYPQGAGKGLAWMAAGWIDGPVFSAVTTFLPWKILGEAFRKDRENLFGAPIRPERAAQLAPLSKELFYGFTALVEEELSSGSKKYLLGDAPSVADIDAYMLLWFLNSIGALRLIATPQTFPKTFEWMKLIKAIGHGEQTEIGAEEAFKIVQESTLALTPKAVGPPKWEPNGLAKGDEVSITPNDYGKVPVIGTIVELTPLEISISVTVPEVGDVVLHFPRVGYIIMRNKAKL